MGGGDRLHTRIGHAEFIGQHSGRAVQTSRLHRISGRSAPEKSKAPASRHVRAAPGVERSFDIFEHLIPFRSVEADPWKPHAEDHAPDMTPPSPTRQQGRGGRLPTVNDLVTRKAPDWGALELIHPEPHFGLRWLTQAPLYRCGPLTSGPSPPCRDPRGPGFRSSTASTAAAAHEPVERATHQRPGSSVPGGRPAGRRAAPSPAPSRYR